MSGVLQLSILGNLGADPELIYAKSGTAVLRMRVACTVRVKREGEWTDETTWVGVTCFGNRAEALAKWLTKGAAVYAQGRPEARAYTDRSGEVRSSLDMIADVLEVTSRRDGGGAAPRAQHRTESAPKASGAGDDWGDDDIPF